MIIHMVEGFYDDFSIIVNCTFKLEVFLTVKGSTLIFISGRGSAISSPREGKSGYINNLVKS